MAEKHKTYKADVTIIGGGLAGIVTAYELLNHNLKVVLLDRDTEDRFGGLAAESFGGVMMVGTPLQRRLGIKDTPELALSDWLSFAEFGQDDHWPRKWAETYVETSMENIYRWLAKRSVKFLPVVNWPERGLFQPGNSVPRWHIAWGTGYGLIEGVLKHLNKHPKRNNLTIHFNHRVDRLIGRNGTVVGCGGALENNGEEFYAYSDAVVAASGGVCGGNLGRVRKNWYKEWGAPPDNLLNGSHRFADGILHDLIRELGGKVTHLSLQWHYAAGIHHPNPDRHMHGLSLVPPRSALWVNAHGRRIGPIPLMGYTDTRYVVEQILKQPGQYSWQVLNWKIALKELAVSGSDYMTSYREKKKIRMLMELLMGNRELVERLTGESGDIVVAYNLSELVYKMNRLSDEHKVDPELLESEIKKYDERIDRGAPYFNDDQLRRIANFRTYRGDRIRTCRFQKILDTGALPLVAIREFILSRKSLGGVQTNLDCRVLREDGEPIPGLYAVGETAGFGGGGIHGKRSLEGTFLGSCILTGRLAADAIGKGR